ncbi:MAG: Fic family protein [Epsilonproteobacteria bacterium]|nr:MAG: Fic family protein [Campylobacterota bacterium]
MDDIYKYTKDSKEFEGLTNYKKNLLQDRLKLEWTYTSNAIEGNTISLGDTAFIIEEGLTISGKSLREHNEVVGHARAIDIIYGLLENNTITKEDIFLLHKAVQTNIVIDIECPIGEYKVVVNGTYIRIDGRLKFFEYPHPHNIEHLMNLWFEEFGDISIVNLSFEEVVKVYTRCHLGFTAIHPFFDGNGRLGRLLANLSMLKNKFMPLIVDVKDRTQYIKLLSQYKRSVKELDDKTTALIEENKEFEELYEFFKSQYQNSQVLLDELKR